MNTPYDFLREETLFTTDCYTNMENEVVSREKAKLTCGMHAHFIRPSGEGLLKGLRRSDALISRIYSSSSQLVRLVRRQAIPRCNHMPEAVYNEHYSVSVSRGLSASYCWRTGVPEKLSCIRRDVRAIRRPRVILRNDFAVQKPIWNGSLRMPNFIRHQPSKCSSMRADGGAIVC